jgi:hypothetical protein
MHLAASLNAFSDPHAGSQLDELHRVVSEAIPSKCGPVEIRALLGVFERFPEEDGYGVFWSIVHFLEKCENYRTELLQSVLRSPSEFNLLMVIRLINGGVTSIEGQSLLGLLAGVASNPSASKAVRQSARAFVEHQNENPQRGA